MATIEYGPEDNLTDLRGQLIGRLAIGLMGASVFLMCLVLLVWASSPLQSFPIILLGLFGALLVLGWGVRASRDARPIVARHLLVWGLTGGLLAAMELFHAPWLPFLGLPLAFVGAMLMAGGEFATVGPIVALGVWLGRSGARAYALPELFISLALGVGLAWLIVRTFYTALEWAWTMQQRADRLLGLARDRQGELANALKSLDTANALLRRTQRELIAARKHEEEARLMKEQFAANISHELRTPLNLIMGFSEMIYLSPEVYGDLEWPSALRQDVYQIYSSSRHLLEMIEDVLDLSRFEIVGFTLNREPAELEPLLRDTVGIVDDLFRGQPVRLEVEIAPDLPVLKIDRTRIRQVLLNLLNNAARFTEEGAVRVEARRGDGEVVIAVSDTGPGIPADELPHLFQEFYQVDRSIRRRHGGAGLGLAISKRFVEAHDGRIWVDSKEGAGSTFTFTLPIPGEHVPLSPVKLEHPLEPAAPEMSAPILVVDSDPAVATLIDRHVEEYEVIQVEDAGGVGDALMLHHPRAVVWNVPPGDGVNPDDLPPVSVPFVECSLPSQAWVADGLAVAAVLTKPITSERFLREVERVGDVREVLVIDDDWGFCQLVERMLQASGRPFQVRRAYDGEEGLERMRERRPDLLLLDLIMPGLDGFQVLEEMRQEPALADVPVVILTATSYAEDALTQRSGQMVIHRPDGLIPAEVLRCLRAVVGVLEPRYDERAAPDEGGIARNT
jgi:signal transduction histidine kinase/CheY-like chemotaxis protein